MKKILLMLFLATLAISCDNSIEGKIKKQFKQFATENFDDPNSVKEIISIEPADTVSLQKMKMLVLSAQDLCDTQFKLMSSVDSIYTVKFASMGLDKKKALRLSDYERYTGRRLLNNVSSNISKEVDIRVECKAEEFILKNKTEALLDTIDMIVSPPLYGYKIKFRQNIKNELKLQEYYGYVDSLTQKIVIRNLEMDFESMNKINELYGVSHNLFTEYWALLGKIEQVIDDKKKVYDEWFDFTERH